MAAEYSEITESNQPDIQTQLDHLLLDLHEALKMLREQGLILSRHDALLAEFRPLLDQFRSPAATYLNSRRARKMNDQGQRNGNG